MTHPTNMFTGLAASRTVACLLRSISDDGQPAANCARYNIHPELFFPNISSSVEKVYVDVRAASACTHCPVALACRERARDDSGNEGFWGNQVFTSTGRVRSHVVVDPNGNPISVAQLLSVPTTHWIAAFRGRTAYVRRGGGPRRKKEQD